MKTCSKCKVEKDEAEFTTDKKSKDGLSYRCKACVREYHQTDAYKERWKAYKQTDAFKERLKAHKHTDAFKEKNRENQKAYYLRRKAASSAGNAGQSGDTIGAQG